MIPQTVGQEGQARVLRVLYGVLAAAAILAPRAVPAIFIGLGVAALIGNIQRRDPRSQWLALDTPHFAALAFFAWALVASAWSLNAAAGSAKALFMALAVVSLAVAIGSAERTGPIARTAVAKGFAAGITAGGAFIAFELATKQALTRTLLNSFPWLIDGMERHVRIIKDAVWVTSNTQMNRHAAIFSLLVVPAIYIVARVYQGTSRRLYLVVIATITALVVLLTQHQSSQLALVLALAAFGTSILSLKTARTLVAASWVFATVFIVPVSLGLYSMEAQNFSWLHRAATGRIPIWGYTAEKVLENPVLGVGTDATEFVAARERLDAGTSTAPRKVNPPRLGRHAHNMYLQTWYELGAIGALILMVLGLSVLRHIGRRSDSEQRMLLATFVAVAVMISASYGAWQIWILCTFAMSAFAAGLAMVASRATENGEPRFRT